MFFIFDANAIFRKLDLTEGQSMIKSIIIKSSYSKLQDGKLKSNFGDIIRSTVLLNCIKEDFLWVTDARSVKLLRHFVSPEKIMLHGNSISQNNLSPKLKIYNLDNYIADSSLINQLKGNWHGYIKNENEELFAENKLIASTEAYTKPLSKKSWQQALVEGMGFEWKEQDYARTISRFENESSIDIGLNWHVHPDWTSKQWPKEYWSELKNILKKNHSVSWQKGLGNFDEYVKWLSSCKIIVTCDTLGLHLASALRKKVVAIVGPTENREFSYKRVVFVRPHSRKCMPCDSPKCKMKEKCLREIDAKKISEIIINIKGLRSGA